MRVYDVTNDHMLWKEKEKDSRKLLYGNQEEKDKKKKKEEKDKELNEGIVLDILV